MSKKEAVDFYQKNWSHIVKLLHVDKTNCINHGFYEKGTRTHSQAVLNMNNFVEQLLEFDKKNNRVKQILDAGCGIGGTVIHLAKKYPKINFTGINIVPEHIEIAKNLAKENHVEKNTNFLLRDFMKTNFSTNSFDAIYLVESTSYSQSKQNLMREMYRILKPGGQIIILDGFRTNVTYGQFFNDNIFLLYCKGWGIPNVITLIELENSLKKIGFNKIVIKDITKNVSHTIVMGDLFSIPYLIKIIIKKIIKGKKYQIEKDPEFFFIVSILATLIGLKKGITYNAINAIKK